MPKVLFQGHFAAPGARGLAVAMLIMALVPAMFLVDGSAARTGYPFLDAGPARAPDIVYWPAYLPADVQPVGMRIQTGGRRVEMEAWHMLGSGGDVRIWESTRLDATPGDTLGPYDEDGRLRGTLALWHAGRTGGGRTNFLYARVGQTLVVIVGALGTEELLRIADSLRRTSPQALML